MSQRVPVLRRHCDCGRCRFDFLLSPSLDLLPSRAASRTRTGSHAPRLDSRAACVLIARNAVSLANRRKDLRLLNGVDAQVGFQIEIQIEHVNRIAGLLGDQSQHSALSPDRPCGSLWAVGRSDRGSLNCTFGSVTGQTRFWLRLRNQDRRWLGRSGTRDCWHLCWAGRRCSFGGSRCLPLIPHSQGARGPLPDRRPDDPRSSVSHAFHAVVIGDAIGIAQSVRTADELHPSSSPSAAASC